MGMPVKQGEKTQFYVVGVYKYDMLQEVLNGIHVGRSGRAHILGPQGELVAYEDKEAILQGTKLSQIRGNSYQKIQFQLISGATGVVEAFANGENMFFCPLLQSVAHSGRWLSNCQNRTIIL